MFCRKPPSPAPSETSTVPELSSTPSSLFDDTDTDDDLDMSTADSPSGRPVSVITARSTISQKRPSLVEILNNSAPPPWTLSALMAYMSQNQCLENLEFTMDAGRYRLQYRKMVSRPSAMATAFVHSHITIDPESADHLDMLWQRLMEAYIKPNAPREVNLPGEIRDALLAQSESSIPKKPELLDPAVKHIHELMEDSILHPFLNSIEVFSNAGSSPRGSASSLDRRSVEDRQLSAYSQSRSSRISRSISRRNPPVRSPEGFETTSFLSQAGGISKSPTSAYSTFLPLTAPLASLKKSTTQSSGSTIGSGECSMTDVGVDTPLTPPITPPMSDYGLATSPRESNPWKRMGSRLGFKKKSGTDS